MIDEIERLVRATGLGGGDWRMIIYCVSVKRTLEVSEHLEGFGARAYHAELTGDIKRLVSEEWMAGAVKVMVATTAFLEGIDSPAVRVVVIDGLPYSIFDLVQMAGRAGRDGLYAKCVLLFSECEASDDKRRAVLQLAQSSGCVRSRLTLATDGHGKEVSCADRECAKCSWCLSNGGRVLSSSGVNIRAVNVNLTRDVHAAVQAKNAELNEIMLFLKKGACAICLCNGKEVFHRAIECPGLPPTGTARCPSCFNAGWIHQGNSGCPFFRRNDSTCGLCWLPGRVTDQNVIESHQFGNRCIHFASKLAWIYTRSKEVSSRETLMKEYNSLHINKQNGLMQGIYWVYDKFLKPKE
jgi:hypothetical protein